MTGLAEFLAARTRVDPSGCWHWTGPINREGYGRCVRGGRETLAHRASYAAARGPVPAGLHLDHLCHSQSDCRRLRRECLHRRCVNPSHLEPVTPRENLMRSWAPSALNARKTHCLKGHPFDEGNVYASTGARQCRYCAREEMRERRGPAKVRSGAPVGPRVMIVERAGDELKLACGHTVTRRRVSRQVQASPRALCEHCDRELLAASLVAM